MLTGAGIKSQDYAHFVALMALGQWRRKPNRDGGTRTYRVEEVATPAAWEANPAQC